MTFVAHSRYAQTAVHAFDSASLCTRTMPPPWMASVMYWHTAGTLVHVLARSGNKSPSIGWRARRRKSDGRSELKYWLDEHQGEASEKSVVGPGLDSNSRAFEFDGRNATALAAAAAVHYERFKTVTLMMCPDHGTYKHIHHHGKWVVWRRLTSSHRFIQ